MKAAIDIGTNSVLLLIAEVQNNAIKTIHREEQRTPRIGKGVDANGNIDAAATHRLVNVLLEYKSIIKSEYPACKEIIVTATSAVRDANNKEVLLNQVKDETGLEIQILSGDEEANYTYRGALAMADVVGNKSKDSSPQKEELIIMDIGGGSTELASGNEKELIDFHSYNMGCVRFTERYFENNPPLKKEIENCRLNAKKYFKDRTFNFTAATKPIGVAGTLTTLAALHLNLKNYDAKKVNGYVIEPSTLHNTIKLFSELTNEEILSKYGSLIDGREDVFLAGLIILEQFLEFYNFDSIIISTGGIRHGALLQH